jgi:uncharacterized protein YkwD
MTFLVAVALAASPLEQQASSLIRERFETAARALPEEDARLSTAARQLAQLAIERSASDATGLLSVTNAVSAAGGWDASPTALLIKAPTGHLLDELGKQASLTKESAQAFGVGFFERSGRGALCVLLTHRKFELEAVPRRFKKLPGQVQICGAPVPPLETADLFVTAPSGGVTRAPMRPTEKHGLCASFVPAAEGRSVVEVLGRGPRGPEVAALFFIDVGAAVATADQQLIEPVGRDETRRVVTNRINGLRKTMGLKPVAPDRVLDGVAQAYAERMATEGFFAHVDPQGGELKGRLQAAEFKFSAAGENLGASSGPLAAHFGIEHSPGHRMNLLDEQHTSVGLGVAVREEDGLTVLVEVLAARLDDGGKDPAGLASRTLDELRAKKGLPPLKHHPVLDALALEHVRRCLSRDQLSSELSDGRRLHDKVFETMTDAKEASVDLAVLEAPSLVPNSKNLANPAYTTVGLGMVRGDSERYGPGKLWLVVIFARQEP